MSIITTMEFKDFITHNYTFADLVRDIANEEPFAFVRFGDGELSAMFSPEKKRNCDGHPYHPTLRTELMKAFRELQYRPKVRFGIQRLGWEMYREQINSHSIEDDFCNADLIHHASIKGRIKPMFDAIDDFGGDVVLVGPKYLDSPSLPFNVNHFIEIPEKNCWSKRKEITGKMINIASHGALFVLCASMMSNVLISDFFTGHFSMIDMGSVLDPYVGKHTRSYHKKLNIKK